MRDIPHVYGNDCLANWPADETPKYLYVRFANVIKCPDAIKQPPNDRMFKLTQNDEAACFFQYESNDWTINFDTNAAPKQLNLILASKGPIEAYFWLNEDEVLEEGKVYDNQYLSCPFQQGGKDGIAVVTWTHQATDLLKNIVISKGVGLFLELRPLEDGNLVYKFCQLKDATNIKILLDSRNYEVTGTLDPDVTGIYNPVFSYNDKRCYEITATQWFLWWDGTDTWNISTVPGVQGTDFWTRTDPTIEGLYTPGGTATGDATVSLIV